MNTQQVLELKDIPDNQIRNYYAHAFQNGRPMQAFIICCEAINRNPDDKIHILSMSTIIRGVQFQTIAPPMKPAIQTCLNATYVARQAFAMSWQQIIHMDDTYAPLHALIKTKDYDAFSNAFDLTALLSCLNDPFFLTGLQTLLITNTDLEITLTHIRRYILEHRSTLQDDVPIDFMNAMAQLCFFNEYVFYCSDEETNLLTTLKDEIENDNDTEFSVALYACYAPLHSLKNAKTIKEKNTITKQQVTDVFKEQKLKTDIPSIKPIEDKTSNAVRDMYEDNPYPRWDSITVHQDICHGVTGEHLIAGCGTGKPTTQFALKFPDMNITAIDLSLSSIAFAKRKSEEMGATNIDFYHGDLLDLAHLGKTFDSIDCSGVLHHMKNPIEGWKSLISVLKPGGRMNIGLYSTLARASIFRARDYIAEHNYEHTNDGIRQFRRDVINLDQNDKLKTISQRPDFYSTSQCRDLVFHIQEKTYTLPEIQSILDELDLEFEGFWLQLPKFSAHYAQKFSDDPHMKNLMNWDKIEREYPNMFAAMYQFVCRRKSDANITNQTWESIKNSGLFRLTGQKT